MTTISPWIVTAEALAPFREAHPPRPEGDPRPLPYLRDDGDQRQGGLGLDLEVLLQTPVMKRQGIPPHRVGRSHTRHMYWTVAQMVAHQTSNGCNLMPGDVLGTGTISGPHATERGCLLEATDGGERPILLPSGEKRYFLEDGDEVFLAAKACRDGFIAIGFGECRSTVLPTLPL